MSKKIENDDSNEIQTKATKGYSLRKRNTSKKILNHQKLIQNKNSKAMKVFY